MTDTEIIKALECCSKPFGSGCLECPVYNEYCDGLSINNDILDLIKRQKAEIKRLQNRIKHKNQHIANLRELCKKGMAGD